MMSSITQGEICITSELGITYKLGLLTYELYEDESFVYRFKPRWAVIDLLEPPLFQGIPGFDLSQRRSEYVRENMVPTFISERAPSPNREHLWELLESVGMDYLNQLEWLIRTDTRYIGDSLYVVRADEHEKEPEGSQPLLQMEDLIRDAQNGEQAARETLSALGAESSLAVHGTRVGKKERKALHDTLTLLYEKSFRARERNRLSGVKRATDAKVYKGRKRKPIDELELREIAESHASGAITAKAAAEKLGVSVPTFYRRIKELL